MQIKSKIKKYKYSIAWTIFIIVALLIGGKCSFNVGAGIAGLLLFGTDEYCYETEPDRYIGLYKLTILFLTLAILLQTIVNI